MEQKSINKEMRLLSVKEACEVLGISHWTLYQLIHQHKLKSLRNGRRRHISNFAIEEYIKGEERYGA
jgi:excisionase family DNA binding protein